MQGKRPMPVQPAGLIAAPPTPMHEDGSLAAETIPRQAEFLRHNGLSGAFVCGSTGESLSLTVDERSTVAQTWLHHRQPGLAVIVHVGHESVCDARRLAQHAAGAGADAIAAMAPCFFTPELEELVAFCAAIAEAAPETPFYYYHIPSRTGLDAHIPAFLEAASPHIPTLAGVKFTHENLAAFGDAVALQNERFNLLFGRDEMLLAGLALGARGAVGTTYNFAAPLYLSLMDAFARGDLDTARTRQTQARTMIAAVRKYGGLAAFKKVMALVGLDCGPCRLPLRPFENSRTEALREELETIGFFDYCCRPEPGDTER